MFAKHLNQRPFSFGHLSDQHRMSFVSLIYWVIDWLCCCCGLHGNGSDTKTDFTAGKAWVGNTVWEIWEYCCIFSPFPERPTISSHLSMFGSHTTGKRPALCKICLVTEASLQCLSKYIKVHRGACIGAAQRYWEQASLWSARGQTWQSAITLQKGDKASFVSAMSWCYLQGRTTWSPSCACSLWRQFSRYFSQGRP